MLIVVLLQIEEWLYHKKDVADSVMVSCIVSGIEPVPPLPSLFRRVVECLALFSLIIVWTMLLSFALTAVFYTFVSEDDAMFLTTLLEGTSGGAFLATVAGTMLPRLQEDAALIPWSGIRRKLTSVFFFELGVLSGVAISILTSDGRPH